MDPFVDWNVDPFEDDWVAGTLAKALHEVSPDPRVVNTPSAPTDDDGDQPAQPAPWNDDES